MAREDTRPTPEQLYQSPRVILPRGGERFSPLQGDGKSRSFDDHDFEIAQEPPFLRAEKRVSVRKGPVTRKTAGKIKLAAVLAAVVGVTVGISAVLYNYAASSWRFSIESGENIELRGLRHVVRSQAMEVLGGDIGRNIFFVKLAEQKKQLEDIPWIESATLMRLLPNRIAVQISERTPVAFVQVGSKIHLIDAHGVVMEMPKNPTPYSFPVIVGMNDAEPLSTRAARMKIYAMLIKELDSDGGNYSKDVSEVDLSDPEDVRVTVSDPAGAVMLYLGSSNFLGRYKLYAAHAGEWRQQFQKLESVDLRYERQIIVNPDEHGSGGRRFVK